MKVFSYTTQQPQNLEAWRFGEACMAAAHEPKCGDPIDRGLLLLRELELKGYGIVALTEIDG